VRYRLLGQLEVIGDDGRGVAFAGDKERIVLAALLLRANRVVPAERLIDAVWGERPPQRAGSALQVQVSRLRKKLAAATRGRELLRSEPSGYRLGQGQVALERYRSSLEKCVGNHDVVNCLSKSPALPRVSPCSDVTTRPDS
jgi:DNA-binding SARP family transcriptional activator